MKKLTKSFIALLLCGTMLTGCELTKKDEKPDPSKCTHVDTNPQDYICDLCGTQLEKPTPCTHVDVNPQDYICDLCGAELPKPEVKHVTGVSLGVSAITLKEKQTRTLTAEVAPSDATDKSVTWSSTDPTVVSVTNGIISALKVGVAAINVTTTDGNKFATCVVTVEEDKPEETPVTGISLNKETMVLTKGDADSSLIATVSPADASHPEFTWSSSDESVATVTQTGLVNALKPGITLIKVVTIEGGFSASCALTVNDVKKDFIYEIKSGERKELSGLGYEFAKGYTQNDVVHVEEDLVNQKTIVYGLKGGVARLNKADYVYEIDVNYALNSVNIGSTITSYESRIQSTFLRTSVLDAEGFTVGNKNKLFLDFNVRYDTFKEIKGVWEEDDSADTKLENLTDNFVSGKKPTFEVEGHEDYLLVNNDLSVSFLDAAKDQTFEIKFVCPGLTSKAISLTVKDGYNAHNHEELKALFEDTNISGTIHVVRNIESELSADRFYNDSVAVNKDGNHLFPNNLFEEAHTKTVTGSVYNRVFMSGETPNSIEINGNFLTVDARKVPDHTPTTDEGQRGNVVNQSGPTNVPNNGEGVFFVSMIQNTFWNYRTATGEGVKFKNIKVTANSDRSPVGESKENDGCEGLAGVCASRVSVETENVVIDHTERAMYLQSDETSLTAKNSIFTDCWGPAVVGYEADAMNLRNCYVSRCGGPALWNYGEQFEEYQAGNLLTYDVRTLISWDKVTKFENWISKLTPWCVANGVDVSGSLKSIEDTVNDTIHAETFPSYNLDWGTIYNQNTFNFICLCMKNVDHIDTEAYKNITVLDEGGANHFVANEQPTRFSSGTAGMFASTVYNMAGAYICGLGQTDAAMDQVAGGYLGSHYGGNLEAGALAWEESIRDYCQAEIAAGYQAVLDVTANVPGAGFLCAFCEVLNKTTQA